MKLTWTHNGYDLAFESIAEIMINLNTYPDCEVFENKTYLFVKGPHYDFRAHGCVPIVTNVFKKVRSPFLNRFILVTKLENGDYQILTDAELGDMQRVNYYLNVTKRNNDEYHNRCKLARIREAGC